MKEKIYKETDLIKLAEEVFSVLIKNKKEEKATVLFLDGDLGAGKTTLTQKILRSLGVTEPIQSPTYTYMSVYKAAAHTIYHFDLYRLSSYSEFVELAKDELSI